MSPEKKIESLKHVLYDVKPKTLGSYIPIVRTGNLIFISGQLPLDVTTNQLKCVGKVGKQVSIDEAYHAGKICCLNALSHVKALLGELSEVKKIVKITGYVNCDESFTDHPKVINGASDFLIEIFGDIGRHARVAVGVNSLPMGSPIEIDFIFEV